MKNHYITLSACCLLGTSAIHAQTIETSEIIAFAQPNVAVEVNHQNDPQATLVDAEITVNENGHVTTLNVQLNPNDPNAVDKALRAFDLRGSHLEWHGESFETKISWVDVRETVETEKVARPLLGVMCTDHGGQAAEVTEVIPGTAAYQFGLQEGDLIRAIDDKPVTSAATLVAAVREYQAGKKVKVIFDRAGSPQTAKVKLGEFTNVPFAPQPVQTSYQPCDCGPYADRISVVNQETEIIEQEMVVTRDNRAFFGVATQSTPGYASVTITRVVPGSAAEALGLKVGDRILRVNNVSTASHSQLANVVGDLQPGDQAHIMYLQNDLISEKTVTLGSYANVNGALYTETIENVETTSDSRFITINVKVKKGDLGATEAVDQISLAPNPTDGIFQLDMEFAAQGPVQIQILDVTGRLVQNKNLGTLEGFNRARFDLSREQPGTYMVIVTQGETRHNLKVVKQ